MRKENRKDDVAEQIQVLIEHLKLDHTQIPSVEDATTWFLGPKAENSATMEKQILEALRANFKAREEYEPNDPHFNAAPPDKALAILEHQAEAIEEPLQKVLRLLKGSTPMASFRNQSHMNWDITMPGVIGYVAAMLYNQNNVAPEASPVTTALEIIVGDDLCRMLGFEEQSHESGEPIIPWGHITCDGSIANGEAMWAARNLTYLPIALAAAIRLEQDMKAAQTVTVKTCRGQRERLLSLSNWELLNLPVDEVIGLVERIEETKLVTPKAVQAAVEKYSLQSIGLIAMHEQYFDDYNHAKPVICVPKTAHYSWPKSATLIGLGTHSIKFIDVDYDGRMNMPALRQVLADCLDKQQPVLQVVAVVGSTEEGAVDPLAEMVAIREEFREQGMEFVLHIDGAWGGYFRSMLQEVKLLGTDRAVNIDEHPHLQLSDYVLAQLKAFPHSDSITIDPHKSGFIPYPAGALCYRNGAMRGLIKFTAPVVFHEGGDKNVGAYGIEGSKPGAAAASVYLSHAVIPLNRLGYGRLLGRCIFNNKRFYAALRTMPEADDLFNLTPLQRIPVERSGGTAVEIKEQIDFIRKEIVRRENNEELFNFFADAEKNEKAKQALDIFKAIGSDLSIIAYAFNFKTSDGLNTDITLMNEMNDLIYKKFSFTTIDIDDCSSKKQKKQNKPDLIVTSSKFDPATYGYYFVDYFTGRAGIELDSKKDKNTPVSFLISTTQNPWLTSTSQGNFIETLMKVLKETANDAAKKVMHRHDITLP